MSISSISLISCYFNNSFKLIKKGKCKHIWGEEVKIFVPLVLIFFIFLRIIFASLESFIYAEFYSWKILSSLENFIH